MLLAFIMLLAFSATALADELDDLAYPITPDGETTSMEYVASYILQSVGLKSSNLGVYPRDHIAMARSVGLLDGIAFVAEAECDFDDFLKMTANARPLFEALRADPPAPFFVNGMAQPIFPYGNSTYYDTSGEGVARFPVYVETNYDTDADGKLDLIKVMVQLPRAAVDRGMKVATIYHAQPYNEGTNGSSVSFPSALSAPGNAWLAENGPFTHEKLHRTAPPRVPAGETTTAEMVANADWRDWRYSYTYNASTLDATVVWGVPNGNQVSSLNLHDYFVVRGFALVSTAGLSTVAGEGISTYGADIEIDAYKCVIDWLNGTAKAYTDKTSNIEIKADWSNGLVGMTGTSYGGTTPVGIASSGVKGLETIIPVCGIASYYDYQNQQGAVNGSAGYTPGMVWYILSRIGSPDWHVDSPIRARQVGYMQQMLLEATALLGNYGDHWAHRDYTVDGWYKDWGPSKMHATMLIVHGSNDNNVRPKQSVLMYQAAQKAGVEARFIWDQGHHMTPTNHQIGDYIYQEWQNLWYSHFLYKVDNNVLELLPGFFAQDNLSGDYVAYDRFETDHRLIMDNSSRVVASPLMPAAALFRARYEEPIEHEEDYYILNDDEYPLQPADIEADPLGNDDAEPGIAVGGAGMGGVLPQPLAVSFAAPDDRYITIDSTLGSASWQNFLDVPTAASTLYSMVLPQDVTVKGVVEVHFRAALETLGSNLDIPTGQVRVHAKLVEIAKPGDTLHYYGTNAVGATISTDTVLAGGVYRGGGLSSSNLVKFHPTTDGDYREIARGWMNLSQPYSAYDSYTSHIDNRIDLGANIGVFHDYTLYLQPIVHTAKAGNRLALILTTGGTNSAAYTGNNAFTFTVDNEASFVSIPVVEPLPATVEVSFPGIADVSVAYYSAAGWVNRPGTYADICRFLLPEGVNITSVRVSKGGMSYQFNGLKATSAYMSLKAPVVSLRVFGITGDCNIGIIQDDWVYHSASVAAGEEKYFRVFDNGKNYRVQLYRPGFYPIEVTAVNDNEYYISHGVSQWAFFDHFYQVSVPAGITDVWISSYDWAVRGANAGESIVLLKDPKNFKIAQMRYVRNGGTYNTTFTLDGSNPFAGL
jgi:hypothetical protein